MKSTFTKTMFESIKESLENQKQGNGNFRDILKTEVGNSYIVRFVPNIKEADRTIYHYYHHGWNSHATGQYTTNLCPTTWGDRCPICEERIKLYQEGSEESKKKAFELKRKENWLINAYIVKDPKNDDNNNAIKIIRYGKQISKIIDEAISGEDAEEFGPAIFDLTEEGCNFRIKVETNEGGYPSYTSSKFLSKGEIKGLTQGKIEEIHDNIFELDKVFEPKDYDGLVEMLNEHFYCSDTEKEHTSKESTDVETDKDLHESTESEDEHEENVTEELEDNESAEDVNDKINELLEDL